MWYLNLPTDGEKAETCSFTVTHNPPEKTAQPEPEEQAEPLVVPGIIGNSAQSTNLSLLGYGIEDIVIEQYSGPLKGEESSCLIKPRDYSA